MVRNRHVCLHQAVHGYHDGHRLLACSTDLTPETHRLMLVMSDMSGPSMRPGFEEYLTGYPVVGERVYAFARTWYAPELDRPGCVWTHTLLIPEEVSVSVPAMGRLRTLFCRPTLDSCSIGEYEEPICLPAEELLSPKSHGVQKPLTATVAECLEGLYGRGGQPVALASDKAVRYEELVLAIWSQQWPRLRQVFAFCTGSLSNRTTSSITFRLQVTPARKGHTFAREWQDAHLINVRPIEHLVPSCDWVRAAVDDLRRGSTRRFRECLWAIGQETEDAWREFPKVARLAMVLAEGDGLDDAGTVRGIAACLSAEYPSGGKGDRVKQKLLGSPGQRDDVLTGKIREEEILRELSLLEKTKGLTSRVLDVRERARRLWDSHRKRALWLVMELTANYLGDLGEACLDGISNGIQPGDLPDAISDRPGLAAVFVCRNPSLATCSKIWTLPPDVQHDLLRNVSDSAHISESYLRDVVHAMLDAGAKEIAPEVHRMFGPIVVSWVLDWMAHRPPKTSQRLGPEWRRILANTQDACLAWLARAEDPGVPVLRMILAQLDPITAASGAFSMDAWADRVSQILPLGTTQEELAIAVFAMVLALNSGEKAAAKLMAFSFAPIHDALAHSRLEYRLWSRLDDDLPSVPFYRRWERCERLRRGLIERFRKCRWPAGEFLRCAREPSLFYQVLETARRVRRNRSFLAHTRALVNHDPALATPEQRDLLVGMDPDGSF